MINITLTIKRTKHGMIEAWVNMDPPAEDNELHFLGAIPSGIADKFPTIYKQWLDLWEDLLREFGERQGRSLINLAELN